MNEALQDLLKKLEIIKINQLNIHDIVNKKYTLLLNWYDHTDEETRKINNAKLYLSKLANVQINIENEIMNLITEVIEDMEDPNG